MNPTAADFLTRICANPADDASRLVYADWLDERGQNGDAERAEFIRVQCQLAKLPSFAEAKRLADVGVDSLLLSQQRRLAWKLEARERELLTSANALAWGPDRELWEGGLHRPFATIFSGSELAHASEVPHGYVGTLFRRGFVAEMILTAADWLAHRTALLAAAPLEQVTLTHLPYATSPPDVAIVKRGTRFVITRLNGESLDLSFPG